MKGLVTGRVELWEWYIFYSYLHSLILGSMASEVTMLLGENIQRRDSKPWQYSFLVSVPFNQRHSEYRYIQKVFVSE